MSKDKILMKLVMNGELLKSIFHLTSLYSPWLIIINSSTLHWSTLTTWWGSMFDWFTPSWFRLSVSESLEWVCTKTVFTNGTITRGCEKTYTGQMLYDFIQIDLIDKIGPKLIQSGFKAANIFQSFTSLYHKHIHQPKDKKFTIRIALVKKF